MGWTVPLSTVGSGSFAGDSMLSSDADSDANSYSYSLLSEAI